VIYFYVFVGGKKKKWQRERRKGEHKVKCHKKSKVCISVCFFVLLHGGGGGVGAGEASQARIFLSHFPLFPRRKMEWNQPQKVVK